MNQEKIKLIINNMELLVQSLKEEVEETPQYTYEEIVPYIDENDVDEYYVEENV